MPSSTPSRIHLTFAQKRKIVEVAEMRDYNITELARWAAAAFNLPRPLNCVTPRLVLSKATELKHMPVHLHTRKQLHHAALQCFEELLVAEFDAMEKSPCVEGINDRHLIALARRIADADSSMLPAGVCLDFSKGWLACFKARHGISCKRKHDEIASADPISVQVDRAAMRALADQYAPQDIYNMDETSFYYHQTPRKTLSRRKKVSGTKTDKARLTMCVATNSDGSDKLLLLFIGMAAQSHAIRGHDTVAEIGSVYTNTKKVWMNSRVFDVWLRALNARMQREGRQILLLVDNASSHVKPVEQLSHVRLEFLPKNTTSVLQPMDQGVIVMLKRRYFKIKVDTSIQWYLRRQPQEKINVFTAMKWAKQAWDAVSASSIKNCWAHSGIISVEWKGSLSHILG